MSVANSLANFTATKIYIGEKIVGNTLFHVLGYENIAQNLSKGPNAMILHFPAGVPMSNQNVLDTNNCSNILTNMADAVFSRTRSSPSLTFGGLVPKNVYVFDSGIYTVVLASNPMNVPAALNRVPENKRPSLNKELFDFYAHTFPGWGIALCCFDGRDAKKADPMFWYYQPMVQDTFILPGLDCHTGQAPDFRQQVQRDHMLFFGSDKMPRGMGFEVDYTDDIPRETLQMLPKRVVGMRMSEKTNNGDFAISSEQALKGNFSKLLIGSSY